MFKYKCLYYSKYRISLWIYCTIFASQQEKIKILVFIRGMTIYTTRENSRVDKLGSCRDCIN